MVGENQKLEINSLKFFHPAGLQRNSNYTYIDLDLLYKSWECKIGENVGLGTVTDVKVDKGHNGVWVWIKEN